ncbi:MAG TPA: FAD/NAD(P)-binding protein [Solirubrobacteraceae bacterium]|nr:FAD/NAD(P)-binding protein [Solirubrobacteraceae bacterium]
MALAEPLTCGVMVPQQFRVCARSQDTLDTFTLTLEPLRGGAPSILPGQFMMVYAFGIGEVPVSVSGAGDGQVVLTVRAVGAVSQAICSAAADSVLGLRGPFGNSWPIERAAGADVVVVAGGIGLAPLRMLIRHVVANLGDFASLCVLYGARTPADLLYLDELKRWAEVAQVAVTVDAGDSSWDGQVGVVPKLVGAARFRGETTHAYVCGPEVMMDFTAQALRDRAVPAERIYLSMERHMDCGVGLCGHCQLGPTLICRDGAVYTLAQISRWMGVREL